MSQASFSVDFDPLHSSAERKRSPNLVGRRLGVYTIRRLIAQGGMGAVYEAFHEGLRRTVALKTLLGGLSDSSTEEVQRFLNEARVLARLDHPNIVPVLDVGESGGVLFLAMELVRGESLYDRIHRGGPLDEDTALDIVRQAALGLQHAHQHGVLHRDLKPANVLLDPDGTARVTDFGVAKASGNQRLTATGTALGTPNYMSPEQAMGKNEDLDARSDVWGLGAILYECLTGVPPHTRGSAVETMQAVVREDVKSPRIHTPGVSAGAEEICLKCLRRERDQRYGSAHELAEELRRLVEGETLEGLPAASRINMHQHGLLALGTLVFAAAILALLLVIRPTTSGHLEGLEQDARTLKDERLDSARLALEREPSEEELQALITSLEWASLETDALSKLVTKGDAAQAAMVRQGLGERDAFDQRAGPLQAQAKLRLAGSGDATSDARTRLLLEASILDPGGDAGRSARLKLARTLYASGGGYARNEAVHEFEDLAGVGDPTSRGAMLELAQARADDSDWPQAAALAHALSEAGGLPQAALDRARDLENVARAFSPTLNLSQFDVALPARDREGPLLVLTHGNIIRVYRVPSDPGSELPDPIINWGLGTRNVEHLAVGDWNGDGVDELFVSSGQGGATYLGIASLNTGPANFKSLTRPISGSRVQAVASGDVNGDGLADFALALWEAGSRSQVLLGGETRRAIPLYPGGPSDPPLTRAIACIALADLDGDKRDEVLVGSSDYGQGTIDVRELTKDGGGFRSRGIIRLGTIRRLVPYATDRADGVLALLDWESEPTRETSGPPWMRRDGVFVIRDVKGVPSLAARWTYGPDEEPTETSRQATTALQAWVQTIKGERWVMRQVRERQAGTWTLEATPLDSLGRDTNAPARFTARRAAYLPTTPDVHSADVVGSDRAGVVLGGHLLGSGRDKPPAQPKLAPAAPTDDRARSLLRATRHMLALDREDLAEATVLRRLREEHPGSSATLSAELAGVDALLRRAGDAHRRSALAFMASESKEGARQRGLVREFSSRAAELCERIARASDHSPQTRAAAWSKCSYAYQKAGKRADAIRALEQALATRDLGPDQIDRLSDELASSKRVLDLRPLEVDYATVSQGHSLGIMRPLRTRFTADGVSLLCTGEAMDAALVPLSLGSPLPLVLDAELELHGTAWATKVEVGVFDEDPKRSIGHLTGFEFSLSSPGGDEPTCAISVGGQAYQPVYRLRPGARRLVVHLELKPMLQGGVTALMRISDADGALLFEITVSNPRAAISPKQLQYAGVVSPTATHPNRACVEQPGLAMETRVTLKKLTIRSLKPTMHPMPGVWFSHVALARGDSEGAQRGYQAQLQSGRSPHRQAALWYRGIARGRKGQPGAHQDLVSVARSNPQWAMLRFEDLAADLLDGPPEDRKTVSAALNAMEQGKDKLLVAMAQSLRGKLDLPINPSEFRIVGRKAAAAYMTMRNVSSGQRWQWMNAYLGLAKGGRLPRTRFPRVCNAPTMPLDEPSFQDLLRADEEQPLQNYMRLCRARAARPQAVIPRVQLANLYSEAGLHGEAAAILRETLNSEVPKVERAPVALRLAKAYDSLERVEDLLSVLKQARAAGATREQIAEFEPTLGRDPRFKALLGQ